MTEAKAPQRVLLLGGGGMLGRAWRHLLASREIAHTAPPHGELDITDAAAVAAAIDGNDLCVINCAAWTDVDGAEQHPEDAARLNAQAVAHLATACAKTGATLVHYSTDYVFAGDAESPYLPDAPRAPLNAYGRSKALGEAAIESADCRALIVRTSWLYAPWGKNFVRTIAAAARKRDSLRVVSDQLGRPTSCQHLADTTWRLIQAGATGIYHVTDGGECSWFEFAAAIVNHLNLDCDVQRCATEDYPRPAKRPAYSVLDIAATEAALGEMPDWHDNLHAVLDQSESAT